MPGTVIGGGGGAGCGSGVFVVSVVGAGVGDGAGSGDGAGADGSDDGAAEEEDGEEDGGEEDGDVAGPEASDVPQAVARKAITTSAALRIAHPPGIVLCTDPGDAVPSSSVAGRLITNGEGPPLRQEGRPFGREDERSGPDGSRPRPRTG
ncbi:hypothetical protein GCM10027184_49750 [Saccharothrix stipae]